MEEKCDITEVTVTFQFDLELLKKMDRAEVIKNIEFEIHSALADIMKELDECQPRMN
jgi:hypothetical protein